MSPRRVQRSRAKGWRMPAGAVYVGRPSRWGNPFVVDEDIDAAMAVRLFRETLLAGGPTRLAEVRRYLAGRDLVCWCPLDSSDQACHADVLLELANGDPS